MNFLYPPRPKIKILYQESLRKRMETLLDEARRNKGDPFWDNCSEAFEQTLKFINKNQSENILMPHLIEEEI